MPAYIVVNRDALMKQIAATGVFNPFLLKQAFDEEKPFSIDEEIDIEGRKGTVRHVLNRDGEVLLEAKMDGLFSASIRLNGSSLFINDFKELADILGASCRLAKSIEDFS